MITEYPKMMQVVNSNLELEYFRVWSFGQECVWAKYYEQKYGAITSEAKDQTVEPTDKYFLMKEENAQLRRKLELATIFGVINNYNEMGDWISFRVSSFSLSSENLQYLSKFLGKGRMELQSITPNCCWDGCCEPVIKIKFIGVI